MVWRCRVSVWHWNSPSIEASVRLLQIIDIEKIYLTSLISFLVYWRRTQIDPMAVQEAVRFNHFEQSIVVQTWQVLIDFSLVHAIKDVHGMPASSIWLLIAFLTSSENIHKLRVDKRSSLLNLHVLSQRVFVSVEFFAFNLLNLVRQAFKIRAVTPLCAELLQLQWWRAGNTDSYIDAGLFLFEDWFWGLFVLDWTDLLRFF